jgi:hypothetical protein
LPPEPGVPTGVVPSPKVTPTQFPCPF